MSRDRTPIDLLVFDLDDTLYPEREYAFSGFEAVAVAYTDLLGPPSRTAARLKEIFDSGNRTRCFNQLLTERGHEVRANLVGRMVETYRAHRPRIALHVDARECLTLWRRRVKTAVLSDGYLLAQQNKVAALRLTGTVDAVVLTDQWGREFWKPHPRGFELLQERFALRADLCAYVSDNASKDFVAPNALGWITIQAKRPGGTYEHESAPSGGQPRHAVDDLRDLARLLVPSKR
ncbi:MAG: HAD family hydrolase [Phycisphaerales bacterium]|nr:MAG: HAD family hydrolase [Phycisphaerales bacterium]